MSSPHERSTESSQFAAILKTMQDMQDSTYSMWGQISDELRDLKFKVNALEGVCSKMEDKVDSTRNDIGRVSSVLNTLNETCEDLTLDVMFIKKHVRSIETMIDETPELNETIQEIQKSVDSIQDNSIGIEDKVDQLSHTVEDMRWDVDCVERNIQELREEFNGGINYNSQQVRSAQSMMTSVQDETDDSNSKQKQ